MKVTCLQEAKKLLFTHSFIQQIFIEDLTAAVSKSLCKALHVGMNKTWFLPPHPGKGEVTSKLSLRNRTHPSKGRGMGFPGRGESIPQGESSMECSRTIGLLVRPEGKGQGKKWGEVRWEVQDPGGPCRPGTELTEGTGGFK